MNRLAKQGGMAWAAVLCLVVAGAVLAEEGKNQAQVSAGSVVPTAAVRDSDGKKIVLVAFNGHAVARPIKVQSQRSDGYLVEGLAGGEDVIVNAPSDLKDGDRIRIKK